MRASEVESALREHPGVRNAVALFRGANPGERKLIAYVVPDANYFDSLITATEEQPKRLQKWRKTFDLMQFGKDAAASPVAFNIAGWNSSYTRQPIPAEEMREWVDETVKSILALHPHEALEIGCGTGLLLLRIAPSCNRYVATDFSAAVLQRIREQFAQGGGAWDGVSLSERPADNFEGLEPGSLDTVILNSVVQYFPSVGYLTRVLEKAIGVLKDGGRIFVGDVLSLPLLEAYSASVELFQAADATTVAELREKIRQRIRQQPHLLLSPAYFLSLQKNVPAISRVEVRPRRGRFDNELTRFRFDVTLHVGGKYEQALQPEWRDWTSEGFPLKKLAEVLETPSCQSLAIKAVPNARVAKDVGAVGAIARADNRRPVGELKADLARTSQSAVHPHALHELAERLGFRVDWSWANSCDDGSLDVHFQRVEAFPAPANIEISWPAPSTLCSELSSYANTPGQPVLQNKLVQELLAFTQQKLPAALVPAAVVVVDSIPVDASGEPNFSVLPEADPSTV